MRRQRALTGISCSALIALTLCAATSAASESGAKRPTQEEIRKIEAKFKRPRGARSLRHYVRYYYAQTNAAGRVIRAIYIDGGYFQPSATQPEKVTIVDSEAEIPDIQDGECSVLYVEYDPSGQVGPSIGCSGGVGG